jgi:chromosome segregation ATPase
MYDLRLGQMNERMQDIEEELELKSGENNRLRNQVADLEKSVMDLYGSRKGEGSIHVELNNMKADCERLINLLKDTSDYQDLDDVEILRKAKYLSQQNVGVICNTFGIETGKKGNVAKNKNLVDANEWIPTAAVKKIKEIQAQFDGKMSETCIS